MDPGWILRCFRQKYGVHTALEKKGLWLQGCLFQSHVKAGFISRVGKINEGLQYKYQL